MIGREQLHSVCLLQNEVVFRKKTVPVEVGERFRLTDWGSGQNTTPHTAPISYDHAYDSAHVCPLGDCVLSICIAIIAGEAEKQVQVPKI